MPTAMRPPPPGNHRNQIVPSPALTVCRQPNYPNVQSDTERTELPNYVASRRQKWRLDPGTSTVSPSRRNNCRRLDCNKEGPAQVSGHHWRWATRCGRRRHEKWDRKKKRRKTNGGDKMRKTFFALTLTLLILGAACGGGSDEPNPAVFGEDENNTETQLCEEAPVSVGGFSILGRRVQQISDVNVCVEVAVGAAVAPQIVNQPECGSPCFTIEVNDLNVAGDSAIAISYKQDGTEHTTSYDPDPINPGAQTGRQCVVGYGTPDPCAERITTPRLSAEALRRKIKLSWTGVRDTGGAPLAGYEVWRSATGEDGTFEVLITTDTTSTTYTDANLAKGTTYHYYVVAFDGDGNRSTASNVATQTSK